MATKISKARQLGKRIPVKTNLLTGGGGWAYFVIGMDARDDYNLPGLPGCTGCGDGSNYPNFVITAKERKSMHGLAKAAPKEKTITNERGIWPPISEEVGCYMGPDVGGFKTRKDARDWLKLDANGNPTPPTLVKSGSPEFAYRYQTIFITRAITS